MSGRVSVSPIVCTVLIAIAGCGGGGNDSSVTSTQAHVPLIRHSHPVPCRNGAYGDLGYRYPGSIRPAVGPPYEAPGEFSKDSNMWWASDCHIFTVVTAGSDGDHHADGLLGINHTHYEHPHHPHSSGEDIKVPNAGVLEITKAPVGRSVETWAQKRGNIEFKGDHGITGTLHLKDDSVTLNR